MKRKPDNQRWQDAERCSKRGCVLDILETVEVWLLCKGLQREERTENGSYKSEQKASIEFITAFVNKIVRQTLVKTAFFQSELGMRAASRRRSRRPSQLMKTGIRATLSTRVTIVAG